MKPKVFVTRRVFEPAMEIIAEKCDYRLWEGDRPVPREVLLREVVDVEGLYAMVTERIDGEVMDAAPRLKVISNMAVGFDNIDVAGATRRGIMVTNTPDVLTETTADLAFTLILTAARRATEAERFLRAGQWRMWSPNLLVGRDVYGSTIGIVGLGRIGRAVARRANGFGMRVLYYNRRRDQEAESLLGIEYRPLDDLLREADIVSLHTPLTSETRGLIGERELGLMKPTSILVNTARGGVVDEEALYRALADKNIWAAGLDVFATEPLPMDSPLLQLDNVVLLPHIGSATIGTRLKMATLAAQNLVAGVTGERPVNLVNPEVL